ncbi:MAG: peptidase C15 [Kovacikia sp.]
MAQKVLLTSFDIWQPHHISNSSDDLLVELLQKNLVPETVHLMRKLPVDFQRAPDQVIAKINEIQPQVIICCGMAEKRKSLTIESNGKYQEEIIETAIPVGQLVKRLKVTKISHNTGKFVCNYLYYSVLKYLQNHLPNSHCIFVHVPLLNEDNRVNILEDFLIILNTLQMA